MALNLETEIRDSYTDEAGTRLQRHLDDLKDLTLIELQLLGISYQFDLWDRRGFGNTRLTMREEALRLTINRRIKENHGL